ncbi:hypothetical protein HSBAA_61860 [Vreelandella sulfidaeris]|uniref:FMN hydroxy acid dehydrogenase domain-containing protein n=1 Tax=Vreelandella sulfidaeris TaxID=115553 RepID=A0A455UF97_9GAMM|nr:hypothetical protein HSBAA_61860 [Halomonas sulfidaeris]
MVDSFIEGPSFDLEGNLWFVDIPFGRIFRASPNGAVEQISEYEGQPNGLKINAAGHIYIADFRNGIMQLNPNTGEVTTALGDADTEGFKGCNDLHFGPDGALYFTDQGQTGLQDPSGRVYRWCPDSGRLDCLIDKVPSPNGLVLDKAGHALYVAVTRANAVWRLPISDSGRVVKAGLFLQFSGGRAGPDGLALTEDGGVVVCQTGMGLVWVHDALGVPIAVVRSLVGSAPPTAPSAGRRIVRYLSPSLTPAPSYTQSCPSAAFPWPPAGASNPSDDSWLATMILNLDDYEVAARQRLPRPLFQYVAGAAETSAAFADNRAAFDALKLVPRMLRGVEGRTTRQRLFGQEWSAPFGIAPMGISALMAFDGDNVAARVAAREGIPYVLSGSSLTRMEEVIEANPQAWFQAYVPGEDDRISALIERVAAAGYETLVLTADTAVLANRENNLRAGFSTPLRFTPRMLGLRHQTALAGRHLPAHASEARYAPLRELRRPTRAPIVSRQAARDFGRKDHLNWEHIRWVRDQWRGRLVLKGLLSHHDVAMARTIGCDGVVLSNHGGRQLDHAISAMRALLLARAEAGDMAVMLDGGTARHRCRQGFSARCRLRLHWPPFSLRLRGRWRQSTKSRCAHYAE